jgi:hypothetical protein
MLFPKYVLEDLTIGSGSIIEKGNIEEFFNHVSMHKDVEDRSLAELAPSYEVAAAYLVHMLEARFVNLNPFIIEKGNRRSSKKSTFVSCSVLTDFCHYLGLPLDHFLFEFF